MKKALALSLSLFALANTLTFSQAHAINWQNAKRHAITGLKIAGGAAAAAAVIYGISKLSFTTQITKCDQYDTWCSNLAKTYGPLSYDPDFGLKFKIVEYCFSSRH